MEWLWILPVAIVLHLVFVRFQWLAYRGPKADSQELVNAVWSSFGPYRNAEDAKHLFLQVAEIVFGTQPNSNVAEWANERCRTFDEIEEAGDFEARIGRLISMQRLFWRGRPFEEARLAVREAALEEAEELAESLKNEFGGHNTELAETLDRTLETSAADISVEKEQIRQESNSPRHEASRESARFCTSCGTMLAPTGNFCVECGGRTRDSLNVDGD